MYIVYNIYRRTKNPCIKQRAKNYNKKKGTKSLSTSISKRAGDERRGGGKKEEKQDGTMNKEVPDDEKKKVRSGNYKSGKCNVCNLY